MKRFQKLSLLSLLLAVYPSVLQAQEVPSVFIQVRTAKVKKEAMNWSPALYDVSYGQKLSLVSKDNAWLRVRNDSGLEGFLHESATSERKIILKTGGTTVDSKPDEGDIVLAGKGFNNEVEGSYKGMHPEANYAAVDVMETYTVEPVALNQFLVAGKLNSEELRNAPR